MKKKTWTVAFSLKYSTPIAAKLVIGSESFTEANVTRTSSISMSSLMTIAFHTTAIGEKVRVLFVLHARQQAMSGQLCPSPR